MNDFFLRSSIVLQRGEYRTRQIRVVYVIQKPFKDNNCNTCKTGSELVPSMDKRVGFHGGISAQLI